MRKVILLICLVLFLSGCETIINVEDVSNNQTKSQIMQSMGNPTKIYTKEPMLKYGADEVWVYRDYRNHGSDYLFYFKDGVVVKSEYKTYACL